MARHVAILLKRYIDLILQGSKTIESRLTRTACAPYRRIEPGDRIYFKESSGPYRAMAVAGEVFFYEGLTPTAVEALRRRHNEAIRGEEGYWARKRQSRYATLIALRDVRTVATGPAVAPSRGIAWFVLGRGRCSVTPARDRVVRVTLTPGAIRNRYVRLPRGVGPAMVGGVSLNGGRPTGKPLELALPDGRLIATEVLGSRLIRWRGWGAYFEAHGVQAGDEVCFVPTGRGRYGVGFVKRGSATKGA
jgi:ASC-1-like (ASCH) protein